MDNQPALLSRILDQVAERDALFAAILDEINTDLAHGGPAWLSEGIIERIEKIVLQVTEK